MSEPRKALDNLTDFMIEDIMSLTDEELRAEIIEDGGDPDKIAEDVRRMIKRAIQKAFPDTPEATR